MKGMKRTNFVTRLISVILFIFMVIYLGVYLIQSWLNPLSTAPAITLPAEESFSTAGIIIREEQVVTVSQSIVASSVQEGEKVSAGQAYLVAYSSEQDRELDVRRSQLEQEISQLEEYLGSSSTLDQAAGMESEIKSQIHDLNYAVNQGDLSDLEERVISLRSLVFSGDAAGTTARLESLRAELSALGDASGGTSQIYAEQSGVFSAYVDGFESLGPGDLDTLTVSSLQALTEQESGGADSGAGKLVTGITWYYACVVEDEDAERLAALMASEEENQVTVVFSGLDAVSVDMRVDSLGDRDESGQQVAVLSSTVSLAETISLRQTEAKIICDALEGIRVPKEALYYDEVDPETGETPTYVYTLTGTTAEQKYVTVIYETADYCLVEADASRTSDAASFREGNTIIVRGRNLYDGKVVG